MQAGRLSQPIEHSHPSPHCTAAAHYRGDTRCAPSHASSVDARQPLRESEHELKGGQRAGKGKEGERGGEQHVMGQRDNRESEDGQRREAGEHNNCRRAHSDARTGNGGRRDGEGTDAREQRCIHRLEQNGVEEASNTLHSVSSVIQSTPSSDLTKTVPSKKYNAAVRNMME